MFVPSMNLVYSFGGILKQGYIMLDASAIPSELCSTTCDPDPNVMHTRQMFSIYPQVGPV